MNHDAFDIPLLQLSEGDELHDGVFYSDESTVSPHVQGELERDRLTVAYALGMPAQRRSSFAFVSSSVIVFATGNTLVMYNVGSGDQQVVLGLRCGGISAVAVHPERTYIAVGESRDENPHIFIYSFPELRLFRVLRGAAERSFANLCFSQNGNSLASIAQDPDYTLTVWDWRHEHVVLRSKAFSQDVYKVMFNPVNDKALVTSGMGHIKFWQMADTFTGLKLQGTLGKFGATELSDIPCFVFLNSGKIISGTDAGHMLLWDGGFIKYQISARNNRKCHAGAIECCMADEGELITAGDDGFIRSWDLEALENPDSMSSRGGAGRPASAALGNQGQDGGSGGEATQGSAATAAFVLETEPTDEYCIAKDVRVRHMQRLPESASEYLVVDASGFMWRVDTKKKTSEKLSSFHAHDVAAIDFPATHHLIVSTGGDGTVRIHDPLTRNTLASAKHAAPGTFARYLPKQLDGFDCALVAGFGDGSVRFFRHAEKQSKTGFPIFRTHAMRPHSDPVIAIEFSTDVTLMTTATAQGNIFFLSVKPPSSLPASFNRHVPITPIGFLDLGIKIKCLCWASEEARPAHSVERAQSASVASRIRGKYLVLTEEGELYTLQVNLDKGYERTSNFVIPKSDFELAHWKLSEYIEHVLFTEPQYMVLEEKKEEAAASQRQQPGGPGRDQDEEDGDDKDKEPKEPPLTFSINYVIYLDQGHFIAALERSDGIVEVRSCLVSTPGISRRLLRLEAPVSTLTQSVSGKLLLVGCHDGTMYYRPIVFQADISLANVNKHIDEVFAEEHFWRGHLHMGPVRRACASFDDALICSCGVDGSMFVLKSNIDDLINRPVVPDTAVIEDEAEDLPNKYTIQEAKIRTQIDEENSRAEARRIAKRSELQGLQREFEEIYRRNEELPRALQLSQEALRIDPGLEEIFAEETKKKVEKACAQLQWQTEHTQIALRKLQRRYYDSVLSHLFVIKGIQNPISLYSFRTERIEPPDEKAQGPASILTSKPSSPIRNQTAPGDPSKPPSQGEAKQQSRTAPGSREAHLPPGKKAPDQNARLEDRRRIKAERQEQWRQLMSVKPNSHSEDPRDVAAIRYAEQHMGDYKLKTDKDYVVPERERVNAEMKHRQIVLLQESLINIMESFNSKLRAFRGRKARLRAEIRRRNRQIFEIEADLAALTKLPTSEACAFLLPPLDSEEDPDGEDAKLDEPFDRSYVSSYLPKDDMSPQEQAERIMITARLRYALSALCKKTQADVETFDRILNHLCSERLVVASDVASGEIRLVLLYQEWKLLKEFEKHDHHLSDKLTLKLTEKADIDVKIRDILSRISEKRAEIDVSMEARQKLDEDLAKLLGEGNKFEEVLTKIFRKKVKRRKRKEVRARRPPTSPEEGEENQGGEDGAPNDFGSEGESQSESESDGDDSDSDDEEVSDDCPQGCEAALHAQVLALRESRLDIEEKLTEVNKAVELFKKESEILGKKEKVIVAALKQTESEIQEFQSQKQQKLNELDMVVPLGLDQIQLMDSDLSSALVFPADGLGKLEDRIKETEEETEQVRKDHKELKREHINLLSYRKEKKAKLQALEAKCVEVQMLKFGRIVDLERLEKIGINKTAEDLRQQLAEKEKVHSAELEQLDREIHHVKNALTTSIIANTERLESIYSLSERRKKIESDLDAAQEGVTAEYSGPGKQDVAERSRLMETVQLQAEQIEALKRELSELMHKPRSQLPPLGPAPTKSRPTRLVRNRQEAVQPPNHP